MKEMFLTIFLFTSCVVPLGYLKTSYGIEWDKSVPYALGISAGSRVVDEVSKTLIDGFIKCGLGFTEKDFNGARVIWSVDIAPIPSTGELNTVVNPKNGFIYSGFMTPKNIKVAWRGKAWRSALAHEFMHWLLFRRGDNVDAKHRNKKYWENGGCVGVVNELLKSKDL